MRIPQSVRRFSIDGGLLLLDASSRTLFAFNDTARHVWDLIEGGCPQSELAAQFAHAWGIPLHVAQADVQAILSQWRSQRLLSGTAVDGEVPLAAAPGSPAQHPPRQWDDERRFTIGGVTIELAAEEEQGWPWCALLRHLETPDAPPQVRFEVRTGGAGELVLVQDGHERLRTIDPGLLVGGLWQAILECMHPGVSWLALIHGAALSRDGTALALAGPSGSGKTTLAAGLIGEGFDYVADDLVALTAPHGDVLPWPLPLSIKPGSFDVLGARYPGLQEMPAYRTKGLDARLLSPPSAWDRKPVALRVIVFPGFAENAAPRLERLSAFQAVERLLTDRLWLGDPITGERVAAFLAWLHGTQAYALQYGDLADGIRLIKGIEA
jgi:hypothetical protein